MTDEQLGLRERKKQRTRETIARVALDLFDRQGYAETTIAEVAAAADVSPRTVSGYFSSKDDLVFPDQEEAFEDLCDRLASRGADELAPQAFRGWIEGRMETWKGRTETLRAQHRVVALNESLQARHQLFVARVQSLLTEALADDLGADPEDLEPQIAAAATTAVIELLGGYLEPKKMRANSDAEVELVKAEILELLDRTVVFVSGGIRALRERRRS